MKDSNFKRKIGRFTYSACALLFVGGMFVGCQDEHELLTGTPDWLGSSIYHELEKRGNFKTTLQLINDPEVSIMTNEGKTEYARQLALTGSKTLFVADDDAYARFFRNNPWKVRSYNELSASQKKLLFKSSILTSAYLVELMSKNPNGTINPDDGGVMRRNTEYSIYDSIPRLFKSDMPENPYWEYYHGKYADGIDKGMVVFRDNGRVPMVHFLSSFMRRNSLTDEDLYFLTNGACSSISESYVNARRVDEADITCQNGYIQRLGEVMMPLTNMAAAINDDPELTIFAKMLNRFCVPVYDRDITSNYNTNNSTGDVVDSVFVWRYWNSGFKGQGENALIEYKGEKRYSGSGSTITYGNVLTFDPGWNNYTNAGKSLASDMAAIIAPTDQAFLDYFENGGGKVLMDRYYNCIDSIPDHIILDMLDNYMKTSLVSTVPSKFKTVMNTAQLPMELNPAEFASCMLTCNGAVYKSNRVYNIPEYQSVAFPASTNEDILIMRHMIGELDYEAYLNSMETEYMFVLPTDEALKNYVDPVDYHKNQKTITEFIYDASTNLSGNRIKVKRYKAIENPDGTLTKGDEIRNPWPRGGDATTYEADYVKNRLTDVLESAVFVKDEGTESSNVWIAKNGAPVIMKGAGGGARFISLYNNEVALNAGTAPKEIGLRAVNGYYNYGKNPNGNGETFIVDSEPLMSPTKSVSTILKELSDQDPAYLEFYNMLMNSGLTQQLYNTTTNLSGVTTATTISNGATIRLMENFNYTIYVPRSEEIQKLYDHGLLPHWERVNELLEDLDNATDETEANRLEELIASMEDSIRNFVSYHIQNGAVYLEGAITPGTKYETSYRGGNRFSTLLVTNNGQAGEGGITITCNDARDTEIEGQAPRKVLKGNYFAREYRFRAGLSSQDASSAQSSCNEMNSATRIYNSSTAVVHLIDKPLLYSKDLSDKYNMIEP